MSETMNDGGLEPRPETFEPNATLHTPMFDLPCVIPNGAFLPTRSKVGDAGLDLRLPSNAAAVALVPQGSAEIDTLVRMAIPDGFCGQIWGRSGLAMKGVGTLGGLIDSGYRGPIVAKLVNHGTTDVVLEPGDRICQLVIAPYLHLNPVQVSALNVTERNEGGLGHTGR